MRTKKHWASFNYIEFELPEECVQDCSASGPVDDAVEYWQRELKLKLDRNKMILELQEYGAWDRAELAQMSDDDLEQKLIWLGAGNISEQLCMESEK